METVEFRRGVQFNRKQLYHRRIEKGRQSREILVAKTLICRHFVKGRPLKCFTRNGKKKCYARVKYSPGVAVTPEQRFHEIESTLRAEQQARNTQEIDRHNEAIRSLIVVTRTCLDSIKEMRQSHDAAYRKLLDSQATTDEKLHILIETVDRIIRRESKEQ